MKECRGCRNNIDKTFSVLGCKAEVFEWAARCGAIAGAGSGLKRSDKVASIAYT